MLSEQPMLKFCTYIITACVSKLYARQYSLWYQTVRAGVQPVLTACTIHRGV